MKNILFPVFLVLVLTTAANGDEFNHLKFTVTAKKHKIIHGDPIVLYFEVRNTGSEPVITTQPSVNYKSVRIELFKDGNLINQCIKWSLMGGPLRLPLNAGDSLKAQDDIDHLYSASLHHVLEPGIYTISALYYPLDPYGANSSAIKHDPLEIEILPATGNDSLSFVNRARISEAGDLNALKQSDKYINLLQKVVSTADEDSWMRRTALWWLGRHLAKKGRLEDAISVMREYVEKYNWDTTDRIVEADLRKLEEEYEKKTGRKFGETEEPKSIAHEEPESNRIKYFVIVGLFCLVAALCFVLRMALKRKLASKA